MSDAAFGSLWAFSDVEDAVLSHYKAWIDTWLAARERKLGLAYRKIARPRSYIVKQSFTALPGEEQTPLVVVVSSGFSEPPERHSGKYVAYFNFGVAAMCMGVDGHTARRLCGHYQTALVGIATHNRGIMNGQIEMCDFNGLVLDQPDEEALGRSLAAVRLEMVYKVNNFTNEDKPDILIPPDQPHPDDPLVEDVFVEVDPVEVISGN